MFDFEDDNDPIPTLADVLRQLEIDAAIRAGGGSLLRGRLHADEDGVEVQGLTYQRCGGGRRVYKKIGAA